MNLSVKPRVFSKKALPLRLPTMSFFFSKKNITHLLEVRLGLFF